MKYTLMNSLPMHTRNHALLFAAALFFFCFPAQNASAETVEAKLPAGITALAEFRAGYPSQPAVLILHGFLQTHHSPPMSSLASNLASRGYTVLSPTISLGVNRRNQSMACEAVHTHTIDEEVAEVNYWVNWLVNKGYRTIIPVGFSSTGNLDTLLYNARGPHPSIHTSILISFNPIFTDASEREKAYASNKNTQGAAVKKLGTYTWGYCKKNFAATENTYLSYAQYDDNKVLELLRNTQVQTEIILGSADTVLPANWASQIKAQNSLANVTVIKSADHFFDSTNEFELAEQVELILKNTSVKKL